MNAREKARTSVPAAMPASPRESPKIGSPAKKWLPRVAARESVANRLTGSPRRARSQTAKTVMT